MLEHLWSLVAQGEALLLIEYWKGLESRFFSRLDPEFAPAVKRFELSLFRHYLVFHMQHKKKEKVVEFFEFGGLDLHASVEWRPWFGTEAVLIACQDWRLQRNQRQIRNLKSTSVDSGLKPFLPLSTTF